MIDNVNESKSYMSDILKTAQISFDGSLDFIEAGTQKVKKTLQESYSSIKDKTNCIHKTEQELLKDFRTEISKLYKEIQIRKLDADQSSGVTPKRRAFE